MGNIVLLDDLTINKIAAGEVIERPANVVKELVENSIDAGATNIVIEVKNGGKTFIRVSDNGKGIALDDMEVAIERHATSKIRKIEDLENTYSMGFRGEALASIAAVSRLTIISRTNNQSFGKKILVEAGEILKEEEIGTRVGTTIIVEGLFFNTPVRYKFLKQDAQELKYIKEFVQKVAFANPDISFKLIVDGGKSFKTTGNGSLEELVYLVYGKYVQDNLAVVDYTDGDIKITGVVGNTLIARDSRKDQIIFLNKRNIKNPTLTNSADQAFKGSSGIGKFGFFILNLDMPASFYDVNVHPTKMEVRFNDESRIYKALYHAIRQALLNKEFLDNNENENKEEYIENEFNFLTNHFTDNKEKELENKTETIENVQENQELQDVKYIQNVEEKNIEQPENTPENSNTTNSEIQNENKSDASKIEEIKEELEQEVNEEKQNNLIRREEKRKVDYKYIGIIFKTYILVEIEHKIYLIDQHAAHERILYEQIKENYKNNIQNNSQMTLIPETIDLTHKEMEFIKENMDLFTKIGFDVEEFGDNTIKINGVPDIEYKSKTTNRAMFLDILDEMMNNQRSSIKDIEERFIATVACKAAVKAGMDLTAEEVDFLIQNLLTLQNPYTCPHGRPTTVQISEDEIK